MSLHEELPGTKFMAFFFFNNCTSLTIMLSWDEPVFSLANNPSSQVRMSESRVLWDGVFDQRIINTSHFSNIILTDMVKFSLLYGSSSPKQQITWKNLALLKIRLAFKVYKNLYWFAFLHYKIMHLQHILLFLDVELYAFTRVESMRDKNPTRISW